MILEENMYVKSLEDKFKTALQASPSVTHESIVDGLTHQERIGMLDTVREMERLGMLRRDLSERDANGRRVLRYVRSG
jgi:hypothetical protein